MVGTGGNDAQAQGRCTGKDGGEGCTMVVAVEHRWVEGMECRVSKGESSERVTLQGLGWGSQGLGNGVMEYWVMG